MLADLPVERARTIWRRADKRASWSLAAFVRLLPFIVIFTGVLLLRGSGGSWRTPGGSSVATGVAVAIIGSLLLAAPALILYAGYVRRRRDDLIWRFVTDDSGSRCKMCDYSLCGLPEETHDDANGIACPECGCVCAKPAVQGTDMEGLA